MSPRLRRTWIIGFCCCLFCRRHVVTSSTRATRLPLANALLMLVRRTGCGEGPKIRRTSEFRVLRRILGPKLCPHKLAYGHTYASPTVLVCLAKSYLLPSTRNRETHYVGYRSVSISIAELRKSAIKVHATYALHELRFLHLSWVINVLHWRNKEVYTLH